MSKSNTVSIRVPGKVILSGEHAVVYGHPAVVAAVNRFMTLTLSWSGDVDTAFFERLLEQFEFFTTSEVITAINTHAREHSPITIASDIPIGSGMGSSAALASGLSLLTLLLAKKPTNLEHINKYAFQLEKHAHDNPSGVDNTIVTNGGILKYQRLLGASPTFSPLQTHKILDQLYIVNTGQPEESTAQMVHAVKVLALQKPTEVEQALQKIKKATHTVMSVLDGVSDELEFRNALQENQRALESLGVVSESTKKLIREIEKTGGVAKITGAGGRADASGMVLVYPGGDKNIQELLKNYGFEFSAISIDGGITHEVIQN